jgi:hypothetical protein
LCIKNSFKYNERFKDQIKYSAYNTINSIPNFTWNSSRTNANYSRISVFRHKSQIIKIENDIPSISSIILGIECTILSIILIFICFSIYDINKIKTIRQISLNRTKTKAQNLQISHPNNKSKKAGSKGAKKENTGMTGSKLLYCIRFIKMYWMQSSSERSIIKIWIDLIHFNNIFFYLSYDR